jgi:inosine-uridine nucleoside N-ribohydrolase
MSKIQVLLSGVVALLAGCLSVACLGQAVPWMVVIDQDGSGPAGSNQMAMMVLLQSPKVKVLGITMVSGNAWEPEEVQHTLRMLELIGRTDVPVAAGAVYPLVRTEEETMLEQNLIGSFAWYGAWGDLAKKTGEVPYHGAYVIPTMVEGAPTTKAIDEDAAHFLVRQVRAHPHQVTVYAAGPLTNIALAISIDPQFAELAAGIVIMGGSLEPKTDNPEYATHPRHEFNFWFDPEAAHIALRANWKKIELTDVDISVKTFFTKEMVSDISQSKNPAAQYLTKYQPDGFYMWDELAAAAWIDPWTESNKPKVTVRPVHVWVDLDNARFNKMFVELMKGPVVKN